MSYRRSCLFAGEVKVSKALLCIEQHIAMGREAQCMRTTSLGLAHSEGNSWRRASGSRLGRVKVESFINSTFLRSWPSKGDYPSESEESVLCIVSDT